MQVREKLLQKYPNLLVEYDPNMPPKFGGYYEKSKDYPNGIITINDKLNYYLQNGILAEEIGHYETSNNDITGYYLRKNNIEAARQELRARRFGHKLLIPLEKLIECHEIGCWGDIYEMCLHLEIDRSYFNTVINDYKDQFGQWVKYRGYVIGFEPLIIKKYKEDGEK